ALAEELRASARTVVVARRWEGSTRRHGDTERQDERERSTPKTDPDVAFPLSPSVPPPGAGPRRFAPPPLRVETSPAEQRPPGPTLPAQLTRFFGREEEIGR